jgi:hypothetical protein
MGRDARGLSKQLRRPIDLAAKVALVDNQSP